MSYFIGIDVGTGSARAGVFDETGKNFGVHKQDILMWKYNGDYVEQSSGNIWNSVCLCVREAIKKSGITGDEIKGIGFDATCSLVVLDENGNSLSVNSENNQERDVIVWMDHRAQEETTFINSFSDEEVLKYVGGKISPEMQMPKLLWIKKNLPETWSKAGHFFDLPDFLTYKATGFTTRSL